MPALRAKASAAGVGKPSSEGDLDGRTGDVFGDVGLLGEDAGDEDGETARRGVGGRGDAFGEQMFALKQSEGAALQLCLRGGDHACGDFFQSDLE